MAPPTIHGEPSQYVSFPDPRKPVTFRDAPFYSDFPNRHDFRDHHPIDPRFGNDYWIPQHGRVFIPREDPWWHCNGFCCCWCGYWNAHPVVEHPNRREPADESAVKMYAPQLCCDRCERRVVEALMEFPGARNVVADQWEKKVVVVGEGLHPEQVLRRLRRVSHMHRSVFWHDR